MNCRATVWLLIAFCFVDRYAIVNSDKLKVCVVESAHTTKRIRRICSNLAEISTKLQCVRADDRLACLRRLTTVEADITVLEPEDLIVASTYNEYNFLVTHELRLFKDVAQRFEMVVLVRNNIRNIWDIKGRRFCHPGFQIDDAWTKAFAMYFENWIIPMECNTEKTLLENRMFGLSNCFEAACIAGPWSADSSFDNKLKSKYRNLCALCDNPSGCYAGDKYHGREGALLCLTDNVGDIAWVRLDDAFTHFKNVEANRSDYGFLCPDGTVKPVGLGKPCVWITKPWPVIIARGEVAEKAVNTINSVMYSNPVTWETTLLQDLLESYRTVLVSTDILETPEDYLRRFSGFWSANKHATCQPSRQIQWCVASNLEDRKCRWLREASFVYGVEPEISCIQEPNRTSCLEAIRNRRADIFVATPQEWLQVRKKGLKSILHMVTNKKEDLDRYAAVVKKNSLFTNMKDLKGANACFSGYRSIGWNAFVTIMRNISRESWDCSDIYAVRNFFENSCVSGLPNKVNGVTKNGYSLCKQEGIARDDIDAFNCLTSGLGDVAFVNLREIEAKIGSISQLHNSTNGKKEYYKTLCVKNKKEADSKGICTMMSITLGSIVAHENITDLRHEEIYSMLLEMDQLFGTTLPGQTQAFSLYGGYDGNRSIIFPERTRHLQLNSDGDFRKYDEMVEDMVKYAVCNRAHISQSSFYKITFVSVIIFAIHMYNF